MDRRSFLKRASVILAVGAVAVAVPSLSLEIAKPQPQDTRSEWEKLRKQKAREYKMQQERAFFSRWD